VINGEISDCEGRNGGAVKSLEGTVQINSTAKIHNCISGTEGGAIYAAVGGRVTMNGGQIYDCSAAEEGGAFFITGTAECEIKSGYIKSNTAEGSAGGVFSGYGATLTIGTTSGTGPEISYNQSGGSGGGIRCDGGSGETAGGVAYIYGGNIHHNTSGKYGGGIACGVSGSAGTSKLIIKNTTINNNTAESDGGGIWIPKAATGINTSYVIVDKCKITNNSSYRNGGGIMLWGSVNSSNNAITANYAKGNGGALCIENQGVFTLSSGTTSQNKSGAQGSGIYLKGKFKILSDAYIDTGNIVYLTLNTYIEVIGKLNKTSGFIAQIDSESKSNGTILVKAAYAGTTASKELYYSGTLEDEYNKKTVVKKYSYYELGENRCLRPSEKVNGYSQYDIILSEKYTIDYDKNTSDDVENMPEKQIKFWEENITISKNQITRNGYGIDEKQHWNLKKDGSGECIKSGETYLWNESKTLYAQWISWRIIAKNRYYAVGQDIVLDKKELLKKVSVENDKENEKSYTFCVTKISKENGETIAKGQDIATEQYISTQEKSHYILTVRVTGNESGNTVETEMDVYVLEIPLLKGRIRFISIKYVSTLQKDSRWNTSLKDQLLTSIKKEEGQGIYKINLSNKEITEIKNTIKSNGYKITREMNLQLIEKW
jgi:hypothetical protein